MLLVGINGNIIAQAAQQIGIPHAYLDGIIKFESNYNPQAKNPRSTATGLIQFMEATAKMLGTTTAALYKMSFLQQMEFVVKYFKYTFGYLKRKPANFIDMYLAVFYPAYVGKPLSTVMPSSIYAANSGLDVNKDGRITIAEIRQKVVSNIGYDPDKLVGNITLDDVKKKLCPACLELLQPFL